MLRQRIQVQHLPAPALPVAHAGRSEIGMAALVGFAREEKWPKQQIRFLQEFLKDNGIGAS